ncbi:hypothetical protein GCM10009127_01150 [Alteraurantiacibacter aestuarii]|uniref:DUF8021 domain-containing protein n=1 Tax=Alteraurantiacibacter aestuarii TaxID=650004 RepID=A0A844ZSR0_9SPHN|nr:hypothetical protein [Alteraurantiacibacter aestuarii]MXO88629.1 hypothetical protein [Alteraurantiacibacter aestuarii]
MNTPASGPARAALYALVDDYLAALVAHDPARLSFTDDAIFTENNVELTIGDGLWNTISATREYYDLKCADPQTGQASWIGIIEESGHPAIMALRLAARDGRIAEVETIICREFEFGPFPQIEGYDAPRQLMLEDVPEARRVSRDEMIAIANGYFDTIQLNDGRLFTSFTDDCDRIENGLQTTNVEIDGYPIARMGTADQFRLGQYIYDDRLRDRRFPLIDEQKGIVLAGGFIDHSGKVKEVTWTDGSKHTSIFHFPHSFVLLELFKIVDGKIAGVEAVFVTVPYNMISPWVGRQPYVIEG